MNLSMPTSYHWYEAKPLLSATLYNFCGTIMKHLFVKLLEPTGILDLKLSRSNSILSPIISCISKLLFPNWHAFEQLQRINRDLDILEKPDLEWKSEWIEWGSMMETKMPEIMEIDRHIKIMHAEKDDLFRLQAGIYLSASSCICCSRPNSVKLSTQSQ